MKVILLESMNKLGDLGQSIEVKNGYARNYLLPRGKAIVANRANKAIFEQRREELEAIEAQAVNAAKLRASEFEKLVLTLTVNVSDEGHMYGAVTEREVLDLITAQSHECDVKAIELMEAPIKMLGTHRVRIHCHPKVFAEITLHVIA